MYDIYIRKQWAIFPCKGKIPATAHGYKDAVKGKDAEKLFNGGAYNVGVATGKVSGMFVLDIDIKHGAGGDESLLKLEEEHGPLPDTVEAITWSGGRHIYFKYPDGGMGCRAGVRPGIDVRGDGGYVIGPPSEVNAHKYEWELTHDPEETDLAAAPEWLLRVLAQPTPEVAASGPAAKITRNRNVTLMQLGVRLRKAGLAEAKILDSLYDINRERCVPPLPEREVATIAKSVSRYATANGKLEGPFTDVWNANFFAEHCGDDVRHCDALGGWLAWTGTHWQRDEDFKILKLAQHTVKQIFALAQLHNKKKLYAHAVKSESEPRLNAMINVARSKDLALPENMFDRNLYAFNVANGTLDLQTGQLKHHSRADYITQIAKVPYNSAAKCPAWEKFLDDIFLGNQEMIDFIQRAAGYSLSGDTSEQCIFMLYGTGMNGKSTFLKHLAAVLNDYACTASANILIEKQNDSIPNDIARLRGARCVISLESSKNRSFAESQIKQLTGGDKISARFLHKEFFDFEPTFKIFFATNNKPIIRGTDRGIWRRIRLISFDRVITPAECDKSLDGRLEAEYEGILAWAVDGFTHWQVKGLLPPDCVLNSTKEYETDSDILGNFIEEKCFVEKNCFVNASSLLEELQKWAKENGLRPIKRREFIDYMIKHGFKRDRKTFGAEKGKTFWLGIGLSGFVDEQRPF